MASSCYAGIIWVPQTHGARRFHCILSDVRRSSAFLFARVSLVFEWFWWCRILSARDHFGILCLGRKGDLNCKKRFEDTLRKVIKLDVEDKVSVARRKALGSVKVRAFETKSFGPYVIMEARHPRYTSCTENSKVPRGAIHARRPRLFHRYPEQLLD